MSGTILFNKPTATLPPLAFATPTPSPDLVQLRRRKRSADEPPPLLKRRRTPCTSYAPPASEATYLPNFTNLPFLDCENFGNENETTSQRSAPSLPKISLNPRTKRSRIGCFVSSSPQEQQEPRNRRISETDTRIAPIEENDDESITAADAEISNPLQRTSSSKSMLSRRPSMNLTRSLSLQFNMSLLNLAAAATNGSECCPLSASTSSLMPKRKSLLQMTSSVSAKDIQNQDASNHRRSPVATTLDYLATAIRFPDVGIGLSI